MIEYQIIIHPASFFRGFSYHERINGEKIARIQTIQAQFRLNSGDLNGAYQHYTVLLLDHKIARIRIMNS
jgi:hypothetical protein